MFLYGRCGMKAAVVYHPGEADQIVLEDRPVPRPRLGEVLIRVMAFGLNRSDVLARQGGASHVTFPRVLGIEAVGLVESAPGGEFVSGETVAAVMGGMGRRFDGGYAEYCCVPASTVLCLKAGLPWEILGALPVMLSTAWGALFRSLRLEKHERLLVRGGSTSIGLAASAMAKRHGSFVAATTRRPERADILRSHGVDQVFIDTGSISDEVGVVCPAGFDKVLDLVGTGSLFDSMKCATSRGVVCLAGSVGNGLNVENFCPMDYIPTATSLTTYKDGPGDLGRTPFANLIDIVAKGDFRIPVGRVFHLDDIVEAHRCIQRNEAQGKIVVLT